MHVFTRYQVSMILGQLYTDADTNDNACDNDNDDTNNDDNDTQWTNHDCKGSLTCMPNEPKTKVHCSSILEMTFAQYKYDPKVEAVKVNDHHGHIYIFSVLQI